MRITLNLQITFEKKKKEIHGSENTAEVAYFMHARVQRRTEKDQGETALSFYLKSSS